MCVCICAHLHKYINIYTYICIHKYVYIHTYRMSSNRRRPLINALAGMYLILINAALLIDAAAIISIYELGQLLSFV